VYLRVFRLRRRLLKIKIPRATPSHPCKAFREGANCWAHAIADTRRRRTIIATSIAPAITLYHHHSPLCFSISRVRPARMTTREFPANCTRVSLPSLRAHTRASGSRPRRRIRIPRRRTHHPSLTRLALVSDHVKTRRSKLPGIPEGFRRRMFDGPADRRPRGGFQEPAI
jgi:hypothetical protein